LICEICKAKTSINYGNAYTVICKKCYETEAAENLMQERKN